MQKNRKLRMSLAEIQKLTSRLYTDSDLRREFLSEPEKIGRRFDLTANEIAELAAVLPAELNFFAESLFNKRLREVEKLLPRAKQILATEFENHFRSFSKSFLPASIKKHLEDAVQFADFLIKQNIEPVWLKDSIRYEQANLIFHGYGKKFLLRRFKFNIKEISRQNSQPRGKPIVAVWFRVGGKTRHFVW